MIGQGFALGHPDRLLSLTLCDTQPSTPPGSAGAWDERKDIVRKAGAWRRWPTAPWSAGSPTSSRR